MTGRRRRPRASGGRAGTHAATHFPDLVGGGRGERRPSLARAAEVPKPYDWASRRRWATAPTTSTGWANRGEDPKYLGRASTATDMVATSDMWDDRNKRAFLLTPREEFCLKQNLATSTTTTSSTSATA